MKRMLCLLLSAAIITGCSKPDSHGDEVAETAEETVAVEVTEAVTEEELVEEILCECEICANTDNIGYFVDKHIHGHDVKFSVLFKENKTYSFCEYLKFAEKSVEFLLNLEKKYKETVDVVKFEQNEFFNNQIEQHIICESEYNPREYVKWFDGKTLVSIHQISTGYSFNDKYRDFVVEATYLEIDKSFEIGIEFIKEDEKWEVNNVYAAIGR